MTQAAQILEMLKRGPVTAMDALNTCDCFRLAARIKDLRDAGHEITTNNLTLPSGKVVAQYQLNQLKKVA
jgi:hypothetical protein